MKRVFAFLLATMMIFSIVPVSPAIALETPTFSVSDAEGSVGEQVTLSIDIASNPGVIAVGLQIGYDSSILELKSAAIKDFADTSFGPTTGNPFNISWEDVLNPNNTQNGTIAELTFLIKQGVELGDYAVTVSYVEDNVFNADFDNVYFATKNGKVTVAEQSVAVTGVTLDETISVNIGEKKIPAYTVNPDNATDKTVSFITSDPSVASVNETTGEITGVKKGLATITIITTDGGFTDTCVVTVSCAHTSKTQITEKASTCTKKGWDTYSQCDICGQLFDETDNEIDEIPYRALIAHTQSKPVRENEIAATCETAGNYDEVVYCTVCHTEISREMKTILSLEHDWNEGTVTTPATCTTDGVKTFTCKHDVSHTYTKVIPAAGHSPAEAVKENEVAATCETAGSYEEVVYCSVCHAELSRETINILAAGHDWDKGKVTMAATCTTDGVRTYTCSVCKDSYTESIEIDSSNHIGGTELRNVIPPDCKNNGYTGDTYCLSCDIKLSSGTIIQSTGEHNYIAEVVTVANCHEKGLAVYSCPGCKSSYEADIDIDKSNHDGETEVRNEKDATCTSEGYSGDVYCTGCNEIVSAGKTINMLGHTEIVLTGKTATCTETGLTEGKKCSVCGEILVTQKELPATGHTAGEWEVVVPAQVGIEGKEQQQCTVCGAVVNEREIPALEPQYIFGDANGDGKITAADARIVLRISAKLDKIEDYKLPLAALDVTGDGKLNAADARRVLRISAKLDKIEDYKLPLAALNVTGDGKLNAADAQKFCAYQQNLNNNSCYYK